MDRIRSLLLPTSIALTAVVAAPPTAAQIVPGDAVLAVKSATTAQSGLIVVSPNGSTQAVSNLDPRTIGTGRDDGLRSIVVDHNAFVIAGITTDNRTGTTPQPLELRTILISGGVALVDQSFATLMQVPAGEAWTVADVQLRRHGSGYIVAASEVLNTANPMPRSAAFLVTGSGVVAPLSTTALPGGELRAIADAGDRWIAGIAQSFFVFNVEVTSLPIVPTGLAPFQVHQFVGASGLGGLGLDVDGSILVLSGARGTSLSRLEHAPNATPSPIAVRPRLDVGAVMSAPGIVAAIEPGALSTLHRVDTLAQTSSAWASNLADQIIDVAVYDNPRLYGMTPTSPPQPYLGTLGGRPSTGNAAFGMRIGGNAGASAAVLAALLPASIPWPFGTILIDPTIPPVQVASTTIPNSGEAHTSLPIPANPVLVGNTLYLQGVLFTPSTIELTAGVAVTVE